MSFSQTNFLPSVFLAETVDDNNEFSTRTLGAYRHTKAPETANNKNQMLAAITI
ncbi:MAG: hypothetical protein HYV67_00040 [Candidatus Taylorbacteria bacterium]|nr:hypothetical protein [Candidatus Taylorbacteria bacterium]